MSAATYTLADAVNHGTFAAITLPLAAKGIPCTPVRPQSKAAFLPDFPAKATTDTAQLLAWDALYPNHNAACVARAEVGGVWMFEVDAPAVLERIKAETGHDLLNDVQTFRVRSREGRGHFYFRQTPASMAMGNLNQTYVKNNDWSARVNNMYCVAPGSIHPDTGQPYKALNDLQPVEAPQWLIDWLISQKVTTANSKPEAPRNENGKVPHGSIHGFMLSQAGRLRNAGLNQDEIEPALLRIVHEQCEPPIDDTKVIAMARSICNYQPGPSGITVVLSGQQPDGLEEEAAPSKPTLSESALASTVLGDYFNEVLKPNDWTVELALPSLVTNAGVLVPVREPDSKMAFGLGLVESPMTTFYTALIGGVNTGKTQIHEWCAKGLGIFEPIRGPHYIQMKFGSAEQMWKKLNKHSLITSPQDHKAFRDVVLINPDEWKHLMSKASIPDSSLASTLTTAFYNRRHNVTLGGTGGGRDLSIPFAISIIGGIVDEDFDSVYDNSSIGGLYDRSLFGLVPESFSWSYREFPYHHPFFKGRGRLELNPVPVVIDPSVWEVTKAWKEKDPSLTRIVEIATRAATVFASMDGRGVVTGDDLEKLRPLVDYQKAIRSIYRPNAGMNPDAIYANVALDWVKAHASKWCSVRALQQGTNYHRRRLGPNACFRALQGLVASGDVEMWVSKLVDKDGKVVENDMPPGYTGKRPKLGGGLVKIA